MEMLRWKLLGQCISKHSSWLLGCVHLCGIPSDWKCVGSGGARNSAWIRLLLLAGLFERSSGKTPLCSNHWLIALRTNDCLLLSGDIVESANVSKWAELCHLWCELEAVPTAVTAGSAWYPSRVSTSIFTFSSRTDEPTFVKAQKHFFLTVLLPQSEPDLRIIPVWVYITALCLCAMQHRPMFYGVCTCDKSTEELKCFSTTLKAKCQY